MIETIKFELNGNPVTLEIDPGTILMWAIRNDLKLTGTKFGCGLGFCGSCTILLDNEPVRSCMLGVSDAAGKKLTTIEGLATDGELHPIQKAFIKNDAIQCGYCTPGMILSAVGLLHKNPEPSRKEIIEAMEDNLCRCGTHGRIIESIQMAAKELKGEVPA